MQIFLDWLEAQSPVERNVSILYNDNTIIIHEILVTSIMTRFCVIFCTIKSKQAAKDFSSINLFQCIFNKMETILVLTFMA